MAFSIFSPSGGNARFFSAQHATEAQRIALHSAAVNCLSGARFNLHSDAGSLAQAIAKTEQSLSYMRRLQVLNHGGQA